MYRKSHTYETASYRLSETWTAWCLYASCCTALLCFSRYCTVRLRVFTFCACFYVCLLVWKYYKPITVQYYIAGASLVAQWKRIHLPSRKHGFNRWVRKIPWRRKWQPTSVLLPGKSHGQRSLAGYSLWSCTRVRHNSARARYSFFVFCGSRRRLSR